MQKFFCIFLIFFEFFFVATAEARWATAEDMEVAIELYNRDIYIRKDGTYTETIEFIMVPLKESGKDSLVSFPVTYNASNSELKVLEAKTIRDGQDYPVDQKLMEDKPLASSPQGFDQNNQILIAFPEIDLKSKIYLKYQIIVKEPPVYGFYSTDFIYGSGGYWQASRCHVLSELPLYVKTHDTEHFLEVSHGKVENKTEITIVLKRPIIKMPVHEKNSLIDNKIFPWVTVSSLKEWPIFGGLVVKPYETVLSQPLPPLFEDIAKEANSKETVVQKINAVTSRLAETITYMGDWRTIKGKFVPRNLEEIAKSRIGDCKDLAAVSSAIFRRLGMKSHVALIRRGMEPEPSPNDIPTIGAFNHAIVYVEPEGKSYWIDPTNFTSFAEGIYPDIADRNALVLNPSGSLLLETTALLPKASMASIVEKIHLPQNLSEVTEVEGKIFLTGVAALPLTGADLQASKESINHFLLSRITDPALAIKWDIGAYNLTSRVVQPLDFNFTYTEEHSQMRTTTGKAFLLSTHDQIQIILTKTTDRVSDLAFKLPGIYRYEIFLPKAMLLGEELSNCTISSPWVEGSRKIVNSSHGIQIVDELLVKKDRISNKDLKSNEYLQLQNKAYNCFGDTALVYKQ